MTTTLLGATTLDAIGRHRPLRHGVASANDIRKYCVAIDNRNPIYLDREAARAGGHSDLIAPPLFAHAAMRPSPFQTELLPDGQLPDLAPPGLEQLQSLLAGQEWEFHRPVLAGETLVEDSWYGPIEERVGRNGPLVFVMEESLISDAAGQPVLRSRNQLIFRPAPPAGGNDDKAASLPEDARDHGGPPTSVDGAALVKRPSMVALFMFDAVIWATHRLHWDAGQARREGLPGPILPGWMAASYLCELAERHVPAGKRLVGLSLKYRSFAFPGDELRCIWQDGPEGTMERGLSLVNQHGQVIQDGTARYG